MVGDYDQIENKEYFLEDCTNSLHNTYQEQTETTAGVGTTKEAISLPECVAVQPGSLKVTITAPTQDAVDWSAEVLTNDGFEHDGEVVESKNKYHFCYIYQIFLS